MCPLCTKKYMAEKKLFSTNSGGKARGTVGNHLDVAIRTQNEGMETGWREWKTETAWGIYFSMIKLSRMLSF